MAGFRMVVFLVALGVAVGMAGRTSRKLGNNLAPIWDNNLSPYNSVNCGCKCSPLTLRDKYGRIVGNCLSSWKGSTWCYVETWNSPCADLRKSSKTKNPWSYEACNAPACPIVEEIPFEFTREEEIPFPDIKCRQGEEQLPGDPGCCRRIEDHGFIYCI